MEILDIKQGSSGPVNVGYFGYCSEATTKWIQACINLSIPKSADVNTPAGTLGVTKVISRFPLGPIDTNSLFPDKCVTNQLFSIVFRKLNPLTKVTYINKNGRRVTTESAYLTPEVLNRPNLKVAVLSQVTKIIFDTSKGIKKAIGVEFTSSKDGPRYRVGVKKEVVVS